MLSLILSMMLRERRFILSYQLITGDSKRTSGARTRRSMIETPGMVETFALSSAGAQRLGSAADMAAASAALPAGAYTTLRTYDGDGVPQLGVHTRRLEDSVALRGGRGTIDVLQLKAGLAAALGQTRFPESRIRITFAPPELFVSVEPFVPPPES